MSRKLQPSILRYGPIMWKNHEITKKIYIYIFANFKEQTFKNNLTGFRSRDN